MTPSSYESLSHAKWGCKYHVIFIPKGRQKALYGKSRRFLGPVLRELAGQRGRHMCDIFAFSPGKPMGKAGHVRRPGLLKV